MQKIRIKFQRHVEAIKGNSVTVEMAYDVATGWRAKPHFGGPQHQSSVANLRFRILTAHGMDLTTILAMEHPGTYKEIQIECVERMERLDGVPEEIASDLRRDSGLEYARA